MFEATVLSLALLAAPAKPATNTLCPVMGKAVTEKSPTVTVRGQDYRICCAMCGPKMQKAPDKYLDADGAPKNSRK